MNRVILCGRLAARPILARTECGVAIADLVLLVPRREPEEPGEQLDDAIPCIALREQAEELHRSGEAGSPVILEGRLFRAETAHPWFQPPCGFRVIANRAYLVGFGPQPDGSLTWPPDAASTGRPSASAGDPEAGPLVLRAA